MFTTVVLPIIILSALGLIAGLLLALAAKFMAVKSDPKFDQIREALIPAAMIMPRHWRPQRGSKRIFVFLVVKILPGLSVKSSGWSLPM